MADHGGLDLHLLTVSPRSTKSSPAAPPKAPARPGRCLLWGRSALTLALFVFLLICPLAPCHAQTGTQHEYELKAGVLYHIIDYVEWPKDMPPDNQSAI